MRELAELHLHLEGAVEPETLREIDPSLTLEEIERETRFDSFLAFLQAYKWVTMRLRTPADYAIAARRLFERLAAEGVVYAEVTLSLGVILWKQQDVAAIWNAVARESARAPIRVKWIADAVRHFGVDAAAEVFDLAAERIDDGLIAIGIGGDEARGPARWFTDLYKKARDRGLRLTAHAGESTGALSIREAIDIGAERIGHGIRAIEDPQLMEELKRRNLPLEICITSNVCTGCVNNLQDHPVRRLFDAGVPITLHTDDPALFRARLRDEYEIASREFGFSAQQVETIRSNAFRYAFSE
jgi:adenosine deaminase/aminodeoxyfutalosine deaminase